MSQTHKDPASQPGASDAPFIVTAALADADFAYFDDVRRRYFPPERNFIPAHITLFHAVPATQRTRVCDDIAKLAARHHAIAADVGTPVSTGRGVAFPIVAAELSACQRTLQHDWRELLRPQDLQGFRPHIVAQNKVTAERVRESLTELTVLERPTQIRIIGIDLWIYRGGPWEFVQRFAFAGGDEQSEGAATHVV